MGTPSDQVAFGLIWYTTVCGFVLVTVALVTTLVFSARDRFGRMTKTEGHTWSIICASTNALSVTVQHG